MNCNNPLCSVELTSDNGVTVHIGSKRIGYFCKTCTLKMRNGVRRGAEMGATFLMESAKMYVDRRFPLVSKVVQKMFEGSKRNYGDY